ncbi:MAG: VOC family protein [Hyphomicrobiales bacterium]|nr:MAG: VOC family protein [Hyphomicrobiales bacterium]
MANYTIDYFELPSSDGEGSRAFFENAFGWEYLSYGPTYTEIREAGVLGGINSDSADRTAYPVIGVRTDDIDAAEQAILTAGGIITRPTYEFPGGKRLHFREPGGAELLVYQPTD